VSPGIIICILRLTIFFTKNNKECNNGTRDILVFQYLSQIDSDR